MLAGWENWPRRAGQVFCLHEGILHQGAMLLGNKQNFHVPKPAPDVSLYCAPKEADMASSSSSSAEKDRPVNGPPLSTKVLPT